MSITPGQKQALLVVSDCLWGVKSHQGPAMRVGLIEVPQRENERREIRSAVFGLPTDGTHTPSGESVEDLGVDFDCLEPGWYVLHVNRPSSSTNGFDEDAGEMGPIEPSDQIDARGPMPQSRANAAYNGLILAAS